MACCKGKDMRLLFWVPWTLLVASCLTYFYYEFLGPENCTHVGCAVEYFRPEISEPSPPGAQFAPLYNDTRRIAVCLVGGARMFELTGRTLRKYLLDVYNNTDVFLHSPLDRDSHKLTLLAGRNLRVARIFTPEPLPESPLVAEVITSWGSPHGTQGLLQYFNLVEGCYGMVRKYEVLHKFRYDWIIRTRVDGYWNGPLPEIQTLDPKYYYVAAGNDFGGLNDRFGMGNPHTSRVANARLSMLPAMHKHGWRLLNSESAYKAQFELLNVGYKRIQIPFCVMTLRREAFPPAPYGLLMLSMAGEGPMSGTYCRPCDREANVTYSREIVDNCMRNWDWPGVMASKVTVCDAGNEWASNWRQIAADVYERDMNGEEMPDFDYRSLRRCIKEMQGFQMQWDVWDAPSASAICRRAYTR
ncbi:hypothetical protein M758_2G067200 [Ceratodon purpureus]|nr:hypothetical protein M758_2G067200 [Ceratodon purpureus]KAG0625597.1 hypothetical protein M758_2G067200 [Ceratodon purpureus]